MLALYSASHAMVSTSPTLTPPPMGAAYAKTLPGVVAPLGYFDPMGLLDDLAAEEILLFREAELAHGRVAMMGALGFLVQEAFAPIFPMPDAPVIRHLDLVLQSELGQLAGVSLLMAIGFSEIYRARVGWMEPEIEIRTLREGYTPGDLGFDPSARTGLEPARESPRHAPSPGAPAVGDACISTDRCVSGVRSQWGSSPRRPRRCSRCRTRS